MIPRNFEYAAPASLKEALALLAEDGAKALAGGMSLIPLMKLRLASPERLVDLARVAELKGIRENSGTLHIGALATHGDVESSAALGARCPLLCETASHIGDMQVRNAGTIGGSVAHADPAADYPAALFALEATVTVESSAGKRAVPLEELLVDSLITSLDPGELITEITVPAEQDGTGVSYHKLRHPASGFAIVGVAARVRRSNGKVAMARVGVTGLARQGFRATAVERLLEGTAGSDADIRNAAAAVVEGVEANSDLYASAEYRKQVAAVYTARALKAALARSA